MPPRIRTPHGSSILAGSHGEKVTTLLCEGLRLGLSDSAAAAKAGITHRTWLKWKRRAEQERIDGVESEYTELLDQVDKALAEHQGSMLEVVRKVAKEDQDAKPADRLRAATWSLERRHADAFGPRKAVELSGPGGGPVQLQVLPPLVTAEAIAAADPDQLRALLAGVVAVLEEVDGDEDGEGEPSEDA